MTKDQLLPWVVPILALLVIALLASRKSRRKIRETIFPGSLHSVAQGGEYQVIKVLVVDSKAVHVRLYKNVFKNRPIAIKNDELTLGSINDADGCGIGHLPLSYSAFMQMEPEYLCQSGEPTEEELEGYTLWKEHDSNGIFR